MYTFYGPGLNTSRDLEINNWNEGSFCTGIISFRIKQKLLMKIQTIHVLNKLYI